MKVALINPGTGPVEGATEANAIANIKQFITDSEPDGIYFRRVPGRDYNKDYGDGRFAFLVLHPDPKYPPIEIQMPGLPLEQVRFTGAGDQNIWHFPRLYVDGSSWVWRYATIKSQSWWDKLIEEWDDE